MEIISSTTKIKQSLQNGAICILQTDTIPGIFADATNTDAIHQIFIAKKRDLSKPLAIFLPCLEKITQYGIETEASRKFCKQNLPGIYTILLKATNYAKEHLSALTISKEGLIGIRIPNTKDILSITQDVVICGTSVNISGEEFARDAIPQEIARYIKYRLATKYNGNGIPSQIIDFSTENARIIRM